MDAVDTLYANTRNNPSEDMETHLPLRITRYELRDNAAAAGEWRGGIGTIREFEFLADGGFSIEGEGHTYRPWGYDGGSDGLTGRLVLQTGRHGTAEMVSKIPYHKVEAGDRLAAHGPSGGGYGAPQKRDADAVCDDVRDGYVTAAAAAADYGVAIRNGEVDRSRTAALRKSKVVRS
jgi:N-methylhydantoinase B